MPFIKIDNPLVVYRFWYRYEMTAITTSRIFGKMLMFSHQQRASKISFYQLKSLLATVCCHGLLVYDL